MLAHPRVHHTGCGCGYGGGHGGRGDEILGASGGLNVVPLLLVLIHLWVMEPRRERIMDDELQVMQME
jgi:hypothetical protein